MVPVYWNPVLAHFFAREAALNSAAKKFTRVALIRYLGESLSCTVVKEAGGGVGVSLDEGLKSLQMLPALLEASSFPRRIKKESDVPV